MIAAELDVPLVEARGIRKTFGALVANDVEGFELRGGEIHALLGENGAGKSTLSKILYGYYRPDAGDIIVEGKKVSIASPRDARALGIGMVFQTFTLIPALSVFENIILFLQDLPFVIKDREIRQRIEDFEARFGFSVNLDAIAGRLSAGEQQQVEILKQLLAGARILILDEPTKVLTPQESQGLFKSMEALRAAGYSIIFISHKLSEVLSCANRITVMRHGRIAGQLKDDEATEAGLLSLMFGTIANPEEPRGRDHRPRIVRSPVLELRSVTCAAGTGGVTLWDISLKVNEGEIVGIAGISGNGQRELSDLILGLNKPLRGQKLLWGEDASKWGAAKTRERGAAFIADDPAAFSSIASLTVRENLALGTGKTYYSRVGLQWAKLDKEMKSAFARFGFPRPPFEAVAANLSGGNLQRMVLTREISRDPGLIVALYPTRGLDVQSANAVRDALIEMRNKGAALLVVSEELEELFMLSDRLAVLTEGRLIAEFEPSQYNAEMVGSWMVRAPEMPSAA